MLVVRPRCCLQKAVRAQLILPPKPLVKQSFALDASGRGLPRRLRLTLSPWGLPSNRQHPHLKFRLPPLIRWESVSSAAGDEIFASPRDLSVHSTSPLAPSTVEHPAHGTDIGFDCAADSVVPRLSSRSASRSTLRSDYSGGDPPVSPRSGRVQADAPTQRLRDRYASVSVTSPFPVSTASHASVSVVSTTPAISIASGTLPTVASATPAVSIASRALVSVVSSTQARSRASDAFTPVVSTTDAVPTAVSDMPVSAFSTVAGVFAPVPLAPPLPPAVSTVTAATSKCAVSTRRTVSSAPPPCVSCSHYQCTCFCSFDCCTCVFTDSIGSAPTHGFDCSRY